MLELVGVSLILGGEFPGTVGIIYLSDGYKHINETEAPFRFDSVKRAFVSV